MPTPTRKRTTFAGIASATAGVCLYLLTASLELVVAGAARFVLVYPLAVTARIAFSAVPSATVVAMVAALFPVFPSLGGLLLTGCDWWWQRRAGLRRPSVEELETLALAFSLFAPARSLPRVAVLDDPLFLADVRGATLIVSRGLLESTSLPAVLAHEWGHLRSMDGRLTEALDRLSLWEDPLGSPEEPEAGRPTGVRVEERAGLLYSSLRLIVRLAGGGLGQKALAPLWSSYWRHREFVADSGAVAVGQGHDLARHLREEVLPLELSRQVGIFRLSNHPPTALRIERLEKVGRPGGTK
jgi:Zn-dependent protease with chaperone function